MGRRGFVGTAGVVAALLLGAAGCGGDPEPQFAPPSETASPTASASESAGASPEPNRAAIEWVRAYTTSLRSGDLTQLRALTAEGCDTCEEFIDGVAQIADAGGTISTEGWRLVDVELDRQASSAQAQIVSGRLVQSAGTTTPAPGAEPFTFSRRVDTAFFELREESGRWKVATIYFVA